MSAGTVGTNRRIRVNGPEGGGNKLQGLPPICNMRSPLVPYVRTRADGENRNVVFCINQLSGGVGAKRGQFGPGNRAGVGQTGGCAKPTPPWWKDNPAIIAALQIVRNFVINNSSYNSDPSNPDVSVVFIGDHENLKSDHIVTHSGHDPENPSWLFEPLQPTTSSLNVNQAIELLNSMKLQFDVNGKMQLHEVGIVGEKAAEALMKNGYNHPFLIGNSNAVVAFGDSKPCSQYSPFQQRLIGVWTGDHISPDEGGVWPQGSYAVSDGGITNDHGNPRSCTWSTSSKQCQSCEAVACNLFGTCWT